MDTSAFHRIRLAPLGHPRAASEPPPLLLLLLLLPLSLPPRATLAFVVAIIARPLLLMLKSQLTRLFALLRCTRGEASAAGFDIDASTLSPACASFEPS